MRGAFLCVILVLNMVPSLLNLAPAWAQSNEELAKRYYKLGEELYNRANYDKALEQFKYSYDHSKKPELFYNMGRCEEALGDLKAAIGHYEEYARSKPPDMERLRARIINLRQRLAKQQVNPTPLPKAPAKPATLETFPEDSTAFQKPSQRPQPHPAPEEGKALGRRGLAGWIVAGAGVALLGTGAALGAVAMDKAAQVEEGYKTSKEYADLADTEEAGKSMETGAIVCLSLGGAALATGAALLALHYLNKDTERPAAAWIAPAVTTSGAFVGAGFRF